MKQWRSIWPAFPSRGARLEWLTRDMDLHLHLVSDPRSVPSREDLILLRSVLMFRQTRVKHNDLTFYYCFRYSIGSNTSLILHALLNQRTVDLLWCWRETGLGWPCSPPKESSREFQTIRDFHLTCLEQLKCYTTCICLSVLWERLL